MNHTGKRAARVMAVLLSAAALAVAGDNWEPIGEQRIELTAIPCFADEIMAWGFNAAMRDKQTTKAAMMSLRAKETGAARDVFAGPVRVIKRGRQDATLIQSGTGDACWVPEYLVLNVYRDKKTGEEASAPYIEVCHTLENSTSCKWARPRKRR